jgi:mRNA interferase RelE/StbE
MWSVDYAADAARTLIRMDPTVARRVRAKILALARDPEAPNNNVKRLAGSDAYRLRVGDWRVIYTLARRTITIVVIRIGHRREIYQ